MTPSAFFTAPETTALLERAARFAAVPLSVHRLEASGPGKRLAGTGRCDACRYMARTPRGPEACAASREPAARAALASALPRPFICHAGFACISLPALPEPGTPYVLTFGPYCPAEAPHALEADFLEGLAFLGARRTLCPVSLSDIHVAPAATVPAIAEWAREELAVLWIRAGYGEPDAGPAGVETSAKEDAARPRPRRAPRAPVDDPYQAGVIAAALAGGKAARAHALAKSVLAEAPSGIRDGGAVARPVVRRARALALAAAVCEAAERAGLDTQHYWQRFPAFAADMEKSRGEAETMAGLRTLFAALKRYAATDAPAVRNYTELNEIVLARLPEAVTLNEVAAQLGQTPSAITHRLQRKFGLSYSEYAGGLRIDRAKELLRRTRLTIAEVARRVGIQDASNFGKLFRRHEGMSPGAYRKRYGARSK